MDRQLAENVANSSARKASRLSNAQYVLERPELADDLIALAMDLKNENHFKACWILELVLERNLSLLTDKLEDFCDSLLLWNHDSALRSVAKICLFCVGFHIKKNPDFLSEKQITQITEACFQWIVSEEKVAVKAYAIRALFELGKLQDWVYPELVPVLQLGFPNHSPAYQTVAKKTLQKIRLSMLK